MGCHCHDKCSNTHCHDDHGHASCGCGHEHERKNKNSAALALIISLAVMALSFLGEGSIRLVISSAAILICGYGIFKSGIKSLLKLKFNENTLIVIAAIGAVCLGEYFEGYLITLLFTIGEFIEDYAVDKSNDRVKKLIDITDDTVYDENGNEIDVHSVKKGDTILIKPGDKVNVDVEIIKGTSTADTSSLTGESIPCEVSEGDTLLSGSINISGSLVCKAINDFENSAASKIAKYVQQASVKKSRTEKFITRFSRVYTPVIIASALVIAVTFPLFGVDIADSIMRALVFMVASCPCAIVISVPMSYFSAIGAATKAGILIKGSKYIDVISKADVIAFDKTGTITDGKLSLKEVMPLSDLPNDEIIAYAAAVEKHSSHPMAKAICHGVSSFKEATDIKEIFGKGMTGYVGGKEILIGNKKLLEDNGINIANLPDARLYMCIDKVPSAAFILQDMLKNSAKDAICELKKLGIKDIHIISGDNEKEVSKIAKEAGDISYRANLLPEEKVKCIEEIKRSHTSLIYVGDGVNDAPSLACADFSLAMGSGSDIALEESDGSLISEDIRSIPKIIKISRYAMRVIYTNITFALVIKLIVLILASLGHAPMWAAVFADVGVLIITLLHTLTILGYGR